MQYVRVWRTKNYAYRTAKGKKCIKVTGFTLSHKTSRLVNIDSMAELVKNTLYNSQNDAIETTTPYKICRVGKNGQK